MTSFLVSLWLIELEPEVEQWLLGLGPTDFAAAAARIDYLVEVGAGVRMPRSRALGDGLFELRFEVSRKAQRITFYFAGDRRIVLLTVFHKQRQSERQEIERARQAMTICRAQGHDAKEDS